MGQYWIPVNLDKKEFIHPHKLGNGLKLWEQAASGYGTSTALIILQAVMPEGRGGGDLDLNSDDEEYNEIAARVIGRWAGDRVALVGDYAEDEDLPARFHASTIYKRCRAKTKEVRSLHPDKLNDGTPHKCSHQASGWHDEGSYVHYVETSPPKFKDISEDVCRVVEYVGGFTYKGEDGWRDMDFGDQENVSLQPCECCRKGQSTPKTAEEVVADKKTVQATKNGTMLDTLLPDEEIA